MIFDKLFVAWKAMVISMEIYRIINNKKVLFTIIILFIANLIISFGIENQNVKSESGSDIFVIKNLLLDSNMNNMSKEDISSRCDSLKNIILLNEYYNESKDLQSAEETFITTEEIEIRESDPKTAEWYDENKDNIDIENIRSAYYVYSNELKKRSYIDSYPDYLNDTIEKSRNSTQISIFDNSFSKKSSDVLVKNYEKLKELKLNNTNTTAFEKSVTNSVTNIITVIFVLILCIMLFYNKDKNIDISIRTCKNGRIKLFFSRITVSSFLILLFIAILYTGNFIMYGFFYGYNIDVGSCVQCSQIFKSFFLTVSFAKYLIIFLFVKFLTAFLIFLLIYLMIYVLSDLNVFFFISALFTGIEYLLYKYVAVYSNLSILHIANVISFLSNEKWTEYGIFNFFSYPARCFDGMGILLILGILLLITINAFISQKAYTIHTKSNIQLKISNSVKRIKNIFSSISDKIMSNHGESYKLFVSQKFILVLFVATLVFFNTYSFGIVEKQPVEAYLDSFYAQYSGELDNDTYKTIKKIQNSVEKNETILDSIESKYEQGQISFEEFSTQRNKYNTNDAIKKALSVIQNKVDYIFSLESQGITAFLIDETGYNNLFGVDSFQSNSVHIITFLLILLFLTYGLMAKDKDKNIACLLKSTVNGRKHLMKTKLNMGLIFSTAIYVFWIIVELLYAKIYFNIGNLSAPIQSIEAFSDYPIKTNILMFTIFFYASRYVILMSVFYMFMAVNTFCKNKISMIINLIFFVLPCTLEFLDFDIINRFSVVGILNFTHNYLSIQNYLTVYCLLLILLLIVCLCLNISIPKIYYKKGESL